MAVELSAQNGAAAIDKYLNASAKLTTIGSTADKISVPQDLKFSPVPSRKNELWVVNYGTFSLGGNMVIFYDAGKPTQTSEYRHDSHAQHFMIQPTALAMGSPDSGYFATIGDALNNQGNQTSTFMGPVLWNSDTNKFARINQNNWVNGQPLGSHLDMLHQSPNSMGIAFDTLNAYWVFDGSTQVSGGSHSCLYHYDFMTGHGYGGDDHSNGQILKYKEVKLKRVANLPSHMIVDKSTGWLYIVDNGNKRIIRVDTRSGELGNDLTAPNETLDQYAEMVGVKWETVDSGFSNLSGIAYFDDRLIVGNYGTGDIRVYDTKTSPKPKYLGTIQTGEAGMVGITIGPDTAIWYVNRTKNKVVRLTPGGVAPMAATLISPTNTATKIPTSTMLTWNTTAGAETYHLQLSKTSDFLTTVSNDSGLMTSSTLSPALENSTTYYWRVSARNSIGEGKWSAVWNFKTIGAKPENIVLDSPVDAATNVPLQTKLIWNPAIVSTSYNIQISLQPGMFPTLMDIDTLTQTNYSPRNLAGKTTYYWHIRALNNGAVGDFSPTWSFTTQDPASVREDALASKISIDPVYPNPSAGYSIVSFTLAEPMILRIAVIDLFGDEMALVADKFFDAGKQSLMLASNTLPSGKYFYRFTTPNGVLTKAFVIQK